MHTPTHPTSTPNATTLSRPIDPSQTLPGDGARGALGERRMSLVSWEAASEPRSDGDGERSPALRSRTRARTRSTSCAEGDCELHANTPGNTRVSGRGECVCGVYVCVWGGGVSRERVGVGLVANDMVIHNSTPERSARQGC